MFLHIPDKETKEWKGIYSGEYFGNLYLTKNIDLDKNKGKILLGEGLTAIFDDDDDIDLTVPIQFVRTAADGTDRWWVLGGVLFKTTNTNPEVGWTQDAIALSPTAPLYDMVEFVDQLLVSTATNVDRLTGGVWTTNWWSGLTGAAVLTATPHRFAVFKGAVLITDGRFINSYDGTTVRDPGLTLPADFQATWIKPTADYAIIGTLSTTNTEAKVFFWDRFSTTYNAEYSVGDTEALCGFVVDGIPYIITKRGFLKRFTGQGFRTVQQFPTAELDKVITSIHPNGVTVDGRKALINVNFGVSADLRVLSGLWVYEVDTNNLYHRNSIRNDTGADYSQQEVSAVGAVVLTSPTQGRFLLGATAYETYTTATKAAIFTSDEDSTSGQRGYIITPKITSRDFKRYWKNLLLTYRELINSTDRIRVLYRTSESITLPAYETITWVTSTTFTGANDNVIVGDFVEIIAGRNAGAIAEITAITDAAPNTFTIGEALSAGVTAARARYLNFRNIGTLLTQSVAEDILLLNRRSNWIQLLIELRGDETSPAIEQLSIDFEEKEK